MKLKSKDGNTVETNKADFVKKCLENVEPTISFLLPADDYHELIAKFKKYVEDTYDQIAAEQKWLSKPLHDQSPMPVKKWESYTYKLMRIKMEGE